MTLIFIILMSIFGFISFILGSILLHERKRGWRVLSRLFFAFILFLSATLILIIIVILPILGISRTIKYLIKKIRYFFVFFMRLIISALGISGIICLMVFTFIALIVDLTISVIKLTLYIIYFAMFGGGGRTEDVYDKKFNVLIKNSWIIKIYKNIFYPGIIYLIRSLLIAIHLIFNDEGTKRTVESLSKVLSNLKSQYEYRLVSKDKS